MKKLVLATAILALGAVVAQAATIEWNFDDGDAVADVNTIAGVTPTELTGADWVNPFIRVEPPVFKNGTSTDNKANVYMSANMPPHMVFSLTIDASSTVDLTNLAFEQGFASTGTTGESELGLTINVGGEDQAEVRFDNIGKKFNGGFWSVDENLVLTGLTGLSDTTVTFTFNFGQDGTREGTNLNQTLDDIIVTAGGGGGGESPSIMIAGPVSAGTEMEIFWFGIEGTQYGVETNSNLLIEGDWQPFGPDVTGNNETITVTNTIGPDQTFYRVIAK